MIGLRKYGIIIAGKYSLSRVEQSEMKSPRSNRRYLPKALWLYDVHGVIRLFYFAGKGWMADGGKEESIK